MPLNLHNDPDWWRGGVIYQVYPRSFADGNGDGVGDLPGITARLPYIASLGVDAVWLSPFFKSPMKDFGYDVSDYCDVDPLFGTLDDFRALVARAHSLGLRVMIDQVLSHTSDQHPWFAESRANRDNPRADWYVWADARADGTPPNNWLSVFGGSAWQWDTRRCQYYLHNFLASQPDLNFHNPAVQDAILDTVRFWLEIGVDGYRLDTTNYYFHDRELRDNPGRGRPAGFDPSCNPVNPYGWQAHVHDKNQPENIEFLKRLRALMDRYPGTTMVGEIGDDDGLTLLAAYTGGADKLHMAYTFELLGPQHDAPFIHTLLTRVESILGTGWPCWALSNHDVTRVATRWGGASPDPRLLRAAAALQLSLRGSQCLYQGDELGLPEAEIPFEALRDPYGIAMWPEFKGRDGCRTPMPWRAEAADMGFGSATPWLPLAEPHRALAADRQEADAGSLLHFYRRLLAWRRGQPALLKGAQQLLPAHGQVLALVREHDGVKVLAAFNLSAGPVRYALPPGIAIAGPLAPDIVTGAAPAGDAIDFAPWGGLFARLA